MTSLIIGLVYIYYKQRRQVRNYALRHCEESKTTKQSIQ